MADLNQQLVEKVREQDKYLASLSEGALDYATIFADDGAGHVVAVSARGEFRRVNRPKSGAKTGDLALVVSETGQILSATSRHLGVKLATITRIHPGGAVEVDDGQRRILHVAPAATKGVKVGATALLDHTAFVVVEIVPPPPAPMPTFQQTKWDEIAGCREAKQELRDMVSIIRGDDKQFKAYGLRAPRGFLMYGPPGCGKTMLGRAVATELGGGFVYVGATSILSMYVGESEERIRGMFAQARTFREATKRPAVIFLDEADAILGKRGRGISSDTEKTIVPAFLTEMDGLEDSGAIVIMATNRPDVLDDAVIRDGRVDRRILVDLPTIEDAAEIVRMGLKGTKLKDSLDKCVGAAVHALTQTGARPCGATLVTATHTARQLAARRDGNGPATGVTAADVVDAIAKGI